jgi:hypothetical protein
MVFRAGEWTLPHAWLRIVVLSMSFIPAYCIFAIMLMTLSTAAMRLCGWRSPENATMPIRELGWPLLNWGRYLVSTHLVRIFAGTVFRATPLWSWYLRRYRKFKRPILTVCRVGGGRWILPKGMRCGTLEETVGARRIDEGRLFLAWMPVGAASMAAPRPRHMASPANDRFHFSGCCCPCSVASPCTRGDRSSPPKWLKHWPRCRRRASWSARRCTFVHCCSPALRCRRSPASSRPPRRCRRRWHNRSKPHGTRRCRRCSAPPKPA